MRKFLFCLFLAPAALLAQGIQFEHTSWATTLAKAKADNKLIFLDAFTSWCGPCKMMSSQTFTDQEVGTLFNASFINAKIDMEKGEGPDLASRYQVQAYPTLLFVDGDGNVVHRALGYHTAAQFLELGTAANDPVKNQRGLDQRYAAGDRDPGFMAAYLAAKAANDDPAVSKIAAEFLSKQTDWATEANMGIILNYANDPASAPYAYFQKNQAKFTEKFGEDAVANKTQTALGVYLQTHADTPLPEVQQAIRQIMTGEQGEKMASYYPVIYYQDAGKFDQFATATVAYFKQYPPEGWNELNQMAWAFYEKVKDPKMLETALGWAKKSVAMEANYFNTDTLAALYAKTGKKKDAIKTAKKAIELAKKSGDDYAETEKLLKSLEK